MSHSDLGQHTAHTETPFHQSVFVLLMCRGQAGQQATMCFTKEDVLSFHAAQH